MTYRACICALAVSLLFSSISTVRADERPAPEPPKVKLEYLYLAVQGASTDPIAAAVQRGVEGVSGVQSFVWTTPRAEAKVARVVGQADTPALVAACKAAGTVATQIAVAQSALTFEKQLHCNGCVLNVKRALKAVAGTLEVTVSEDRLSVVVVYDTRRVSVARMEQALATAGYPVKPQP